MINGINEKRSYKNNLPHDFNIDSYRSLNDDLKHLNDEELINHYLINGINEKRRYKLPHGFDLNSYRILNNDLQQFNDKELFNHYVTYGINERRRYKYKLPYDFNLDSYRNLNIDLNQFNDQQLLNHYLINGINERRRYKYNFRNSYDTKEFIKNHINISYNYIEINNLSNNIFNDINLYFNSNLNEFNLFNNITFFDYNIDDSIYKTNNNFLYNKYENNLENKLNNIINLIKNAFQEGKENMLIIFNKNISVKYLQYYNKPIKNILENNNNIYDIIELSLINDNSSFYDLINKELQILNIDDIDKHFFDSIYITKNGLKKIYNNSTFILNNYKLGFYSRPIFKYNIQNFDLNNEELYIYYLSSVLWDSFYRVTSYWNKVYCVNLGFDIKKREQMMKYCNLLNCDEETFFYDGILGLNLPNIDTLINMGIYNSSIKNKFNIKTGTIGLNITQSDIINESINNNYKYTLILEDDISFNENYFEVLDIIFDKYKDIDILYLGYLIYDHENHDIFDVIYNINNYIIYKPKKDLCEKIYISGFYAVLLSNKALKIYIDKYTPIDNISDVLLCDLAFDIKNDFSNNSFTKTNYNLNTILIDDFVKVDTSKPSLTEENNFDMISEFKHNSSFIYLSKIKKFNFKITKNFIIKIYLSEYIKLYYSKIVDIIKNIIKNIEVIDYFDENTDIVLYTCHDTIELNDQNINICVNGENRDCQELTDIAILSRKKYDYKYNIYFPQLFTSLWERKKDYYIIKNNTREYFCAYMYSYDVEYRVELYNFISNYKKVDALGKSCSNKEETDRFVYNDEITYNDIAIEKYLKYKFVLALENTVCDGYITEKLINPILANSIPIYAGPKDAFEIINKKRVIYIYDFNNYNDLLDYIIKVDNDNDLYNSIISEEIFVGNINFNNFEEYLSLQCKKALGLTSKNILLCNNELINYNNYDFIIKNFQIPFNNIKLIKRYLNDYINKDDNIILNYYNNINYIDNIFWINLDRSIERKNNMESILNNINIPYKRISAVDAKDPTFPTIINNLEIKDSLSNYEIACTLSHLKAINHASQNKGEYFMICEDDITFDNLKYFKKTLKDIILNSPPFDILLIYKTCLFEIEETYAKWIDYYDKGIDFYIYGTCCYIISRSGINKINNYIKFDENNNFIINNKKIIDVADIYLYDKLNTYVYKYNFIETFNNISTIHDNHLGFHEQCSKKEYDLIMRDIDML